MDTSVNFNNNSFVTNHKIHLVIIMGSPATPPWMSELVARNHKVVRMIPHRNSTDSSVVNGDGVHNNESVSTLSTSKRAKTGGNHHHKKQVVEPKSASIKATGGTLPNKGITTMADVVVSVQEQMHRTRANKRSNSTGKLYCIFTRSGP